MTSYEIRAFRGDARVATAVAWNGKILQVYPTRAEFDDEAAWRATCADARFDVSTAAAVPAAPSQKKTRLAILVQRRIESEFMQFFEPSYKTEFKAVTLVRDPVPTVHVTMSGEDGVETVWTVQRSANVLEPPQLTKNGAPVTEDYEWSPALTCVKWLLMVAHKTT